MRELLVILLSLYAMFQNVVVGNTSVGGQTVIGGGVTGGACTTLSDSVTTGTVAESVWSSSGKVWNAGTFTAGSSYTLCKLSISAAKVGSPTMSVTAFIYNDSSNAPGSQVGTGSGSVAVSTFPASQGDVFFTGMNVSIVNGTKYWIAIQSTAQDGVNNASWFVGAGSDFFDASANGTTWTNEDSNIKARFATYH